MRKVIDYIMKCYITTTSVGFIVTDENNKVVDYSLFDNKALELLESIRNKELTNDEKALIQHNLEKYDEVIIETNNNISSYSNLDDYDRISIEKTTKNGRYVRSHLSEILDETGEFENFDLRGYLHETYQNLSDNKIRQSIKTNDIMIVETINAIEELEETTSKMIERLREWCTPYLPELDKIHNHELYAKIVAIETTRENIKKSTLLDNSNVSLSDSYDIMMEDDDLKLIKSFAQNVVDTYATKHQLDNYIQEKIKEIAPNLYDVAGANLSAKLIAHMNGLENLAKLPSSTVQIIGAEKAIFRHLKTGENPPKHGLIFQHPSIRGSNWWVRGKLARAVANSISIAARKDAFSNDYDPNLKTALDEKVEKIKKSHPFPERRNKDKKNNDKKDKKNRKERKKKKNRKKKLKKGEYVY